MKKVNFVRLKLKQLKDTSKGYPRYKVRNEEKDAAIEQMLKMGILKKYKTGIEITRNTDFSLTVRGNCFNKCNDILVFCDFK